MIGVVLALLSAATSGLSVVLVRRRSDGSNAFNVSLVITLVGMAALWPVAFMLTDVEAFNVLGFALFALGGMLSPGLVRLLYYHGMGKLGAPVNSSIYCVYPLYSIIIAILWLDETLSVWNAAGIGCVLLGIVAMNLNNYHRNSRERREWRNVIFPVLGGVTFGVSAVIRKLALDLWNVPVFGVAVGYTFALLPYALLLLSAVPVRRQLKLKQDFRWFWIVGITQAITWILAFYALTFEEVSITVPLMSVEPLFVVGFAYLYLRRVENLTHQLFGSVLLTVLGVVLITI